MSRRRQSRAFALLWFGEGTSMLGSTTTAVVLPLLAATRFDAGPVWMGVLAAAAWVPWVLFGVPVGALLDHVDPRHPMMATDVVAATILASVPIAAALGLLTLPHVAVASFAAGISALMVSTGVASLLPHVAADDLEGANSRVYGTESAAQIAGPGLGGLLVQLVGAATALVVDAAATLVAAVCLWRIGPTPPRPHEGPARSGGVLVQGWRVIRRDRFMRYNVLTGAASNFGLTGYQALLILFLLRDVGLSPGQVGLWEAMGAAGGLLGALAAPVVGRRLGTARASVVLELVGGPTALLIPLGAPGWRAWLVPLGVALVGFGVVGANVLRAAFRQRWVPRDLLGRVSGASGVVNMGTMPVAALLAGWAGGAFGIVPTMVAATAIHAVTALTLVTPLCPFARLREFPAGQMPALDA